MECARVIRARISAGEWPSFLPGERELAELLHVGRDTVRLALTELTQTGWLSPADHGKRRRVLTPEKSAPAPEKNSHLRIGMLSPYGLMQISQIMLSEVDHIRSHLAQHGGSLEIYNPSFLHQQQPDKALTTFTKEHQCDAWILHRTTAPVQQHFQHEGIPCLIRGHPHVGVSLPFIDYDWRAIARHAMAELWRNGHRRIGIIMPADGLQGNYAALEGAREFNEQDVILTEIRESRTANSLVRSLSKWIDKPECPTAFIAIRPRQALTLMTWLGSIGRPVPHWHSIISLADEPLFEHLVPTIACYSTISLQFARKVVKNLQLLATGQRQQLVHSLIMPDFQSAESIKKLI